MASPSEGNELSFERDIKPLFRAKDRDSMLQAFDLFDYENVVEHADAIVGALRSGRMPCDGAWPIPRSTNSSSGLTRARPPRFAAPPRSARRPGRGRPGRSPRWDDLSTRRATRVSSSTAGRRSSPGSAPRLRTCTAVPADDSGYGVNGVDSVERGVR
jgi:hypothetical protein